MCKALGPRRGSFANALSIGEVNDVRCEWHARQKTQWGLGGGGDGEVQMAAPKRKSVTWVGLGGLELTRGGCCGVPLGSHWYLLECGEGECRGIAWRQERKGSTVGNRTGRCKGAFRKRLLSAGAG